MESRGWSDPDTLCVLMNQGTFWPTSHLTLDPNSRTPHPICTGMGTPGNRVLEVFLWKLGTGRRIGVPCAREVQGSCHLVATGTDLV